MIDGIFVFFPALITYLFLYFETNIDKPAINSIVNYLISDLGKTDTMEILIQCKYLFLFITIISFALEFRRFPEKKVKYIYENQKIKL